MITDSDPTSTSHDGHSHPPEGWQGVPGGVTHEPHAHGDHMSHEVVHHVQELRRQSGLAADDHIALHLGTTSDSLQHAINTHRDFIVKATLAAQPSSLPLSGEGVFSSQVTVEGHPLTIELRRVAAPTPAVAPAPEAPPAAPKPAKAKPAAKPAKVAKPAKPAKKAAKPKVKVKAKAKVAGKAMAAARKTAKPKKVVKKPAKAKAKKAPVKKAGKSKAKRR
jgi:hypothetical protein